MKSAILRTAVAAIVAATTLLGPVPVTVHAVATCATDGAHWYGRATSGWGANGTQLAHSLPASWHVDQAGGGTMDEAVWLSNHNNLNQALEVGYFSGTWPYGTGGWFTGLMPYVTFNNGAQGARSSTALNPQSLLMKVVQGSSGYGIVGPTRFNFNYSVSNGQNMGQGEVTANTKSWMDDGTGTHPFTGQWTNNGGTNWYAWAFHNDCQNSPYWVTSQNASVYKNGGFGN